MPDAQFTVRDLRRRWKPAKERLAGSKQHEPLLVRIHRACSWLQRVEQLDPEATDDKLIFQWIALNALYGQWNNDRREPLPDTVCLQRFLKQISDLDKDGRITQLLTDHRALVFSVYDDQHLSSFFWEEPSDARAKQTMSTHYKANTWYLEKRWGMVLDRLLERIYLLRCQLVHGAATCRGELNRNVLQTCGQVMDLLLPAVLLVLIDHGADIDWGPLCYPPLR